MSPPEGKGLQFQVFITTHSPYFVDLENFQSLRRVEKMLHTGGPMETKIQFTSLANVGEALLKAYSKEGEVTENSSWARMKSILGIKGSEGFFANAVILVEGQEDEAILTAYAEHKNVSLDNQGIAIIPAESKTKIPPLLVLYGKLELRTFAYLTEMATKVIPRMHMSIQTKRCFASWVRNQKSVQKPRFMKVERFGKTTLRRR